MKNVIVEFAEAVERAKKEKEATELAERAEEARRLRLEEEQAFVDSVVKGEEGIRMQLDVLRKECASDAISFQRDWCFAYFVQSNGSASERSQI